MIKITRDFNNVLIFLLICLFANFNWNATIAEISGLIEVFGDLHAPFAQKMVASKAALTQTGSTRIRGQNDRTLYDLDFYTLTPDFLDLLFIDSYGCHNGFGRR
jgi:hypothetical protein